MKNHNYSRVPFEIIEKAVQGDEDSIQAVLSHFTYYMYKLSQRKVIDDYGGSKTVLDEDTLSSLKAKLTVAILNFKMH